MLSNLGLSTEVEASGAVVVINEENLFSSWSEEEEEELLFVLMRKEGRCDVNSASLLSSVSMGLTTTGSWCNGAGLSRLMLLSRTLLLFLFSSSSEEELEEEDCRKDGRKREEERTSVDLTMMGAFTSELPLLEEEEELLDLVRTIDAVMDGAEARRGAGRETWETWILASSTVEEEEEEEVESFLATTGCLTPIATSVISLTLMTWSLLEEEEEEVLSLLWTMSCMKLVLLTLESSLEEEESIECWERWMPHPTFFLILSIMSPE